MRAVKVKALRKKFKPPEGRNREYRYSKGNTRICIDRGYILYKQAKKVYGKGKRLPLD